MMKRINPIWLLLVWCSHLSFAQGTTSQLPAAKPVLLPPSPEAFQFTRYGNLPIGLSTGAAQFTLPVYTIRSGSLSHAISLGYSTNGVKTDELASRTGLGFSARMGGMISRVVMDKPDGSGGVQPAYYHGSLNLNPGNWALYNYARQASYEMASDFQPDEYSFSMDGYSGKFIKRENGSFTLLGVSGIRIQQNSQGFLLTASNGVQYQFYRYESARNYSYPLSTTQQWVPAPVATAWYLTKITAPNKDSIVFNYTYTNPVIPNTITYLNGISQELGTTLTAPDGNANAGYFRIDYNGAPDNNTTLRAGCAQTPGLSTQIQLTDNSPFCVQSIDFAGGQVRLSYSDREDAPGEKKLDSISVYRNSDGYRVSATVLGYSYSYAAPGNYDTYLGSVNYTNEHPYLRKRLFLTNAEAIAPGLPPQRYSFVYNDINGLPPRLSFSQDRFGSANGKVNRDFFFPNDTWLDEWLGNNGLGADRSYSFAHAQKGALTRITYPGGGYTTFGYEPNRVAGDFAFTVQSDSVVALLDTSTAMGQEAWSSPITHSGGHLRMRVSCQWASVPISTTAANGGATELDGSYFISWYLINTATNACTKVCGKVLYPGDWFADGYMGVGLPAGSYRIKLVASKPSLRCRLSLERWQRVADHSPDAGIAGIRVKAVQDADQQGRAVQRRQYLYSHWGDTTASTGTGLSGYQFANAGAELGFAEQLPTGNGSICGYNTLSSNSVTPNFLNDQGTVFYTTVNEVLTDTTGTRNNGGTEHEFYYTDKKTAMPLRWDWYNGWMDITQPLPTTPGAPLMNNDFLTGLPKRSRTYTCTAIHGSRTMLTESRQYYSVDTPSLATDTFLVARYARPFTCPTPNGCLSGLPPEQQTLLYCYDLYRYWRYYGFVKLDSSQTLSYTPTGTQATTIQYDNYSLQHYQPRTVTTLSGTGDRKTLYRRYSADIGSTEAGYATIYQPMSATGITDAVVNESVYDHTTLQSHSRVAYGVYPARGGGSLYLPAQLWNAFPGMAENVALTYDRYDSAGNPLQYTTQEGMVTAILWGYGGLYVVAQVAGKSYAEAVQQSGVDMAVLNAPASEAALRSELAKLRSLPGVQVVTRTYNPLIGITSETDANGKMLYYYYDAFSRLQLVKDQEGHTVKQFNYAYKTGL
jgi:YD repeat-containing protein